MEEKGQAKTTAEKGTESARKIRAMVKNIYRGANEAKAQGRKVAYFMVVSQYDEILRAMDVVPIPTENYAGLCAAKRDMDRFLLKAEADGLMVGFIAGDIRASQRLAWIATIGVLPEYRGRGIGRQLLEACEAQIHEPTVRLCVRAANQTAIQLYLSSGYQRAGLWPDYYQDGEDALVMEKKL